MKRKILATALVGLWLAAGAATAHEGHEHKAMGTVAAVDAKHVEVADKDGRKTSFQLTPETKYQRGTTAATASQLAVGQRVVVAYEEKDKLLLAHQVTIGAQEKTTAQPHP